MKKRNFSAEFKRESAQLVVDQKYTVADAAKAMDVGLSTMTRWVKQLRDERQGKTPKASPITPEQIEIRELRKKLQRIEMENEILKKGYRALDVRLPEQFSIIGKLRAHYPVGHTLPCVRGSSIGIKTPKRLKKHHKTDVSSTPLLLHMNGTDD
ncbi:transposase family protein [Shigella flexneri K-1770]|nr:transposase family protein [Shigella flexneri K-1770]